MKTKHIHTLSRGRCCSSCTGTQSFELARLRSWPRCTVVQQRHDTTLSSESTERRYYAVAALERSGLASSNTMRVSPSVAQCAVCVRTTGGQTLLRTKETTAAWECRGKQFVWPVCVVGGAGWLGCWAWRLGGQRGPTEGGYKSPFVVHVCMYVCTVHVRDSFDGQHTEQEGQQRTGSECVSEKKRSWVDGMDGWMDGGGLWKQTCTQSSGRLPIRK